jgi:hypothetical protein
METGVQLLEPVRFRSARAGQRTNPCYSEPFRITSALAVSDPMPHNRSPFNSLLAGLFVTLAQLFVAVVLIAPQGPISWRYSTLIQHDGYWFANIVDRGYDTTVPPISHKMMEVSNVAFFPAYPAIAGLLRHGLNFTTSNALLVTAQGAAFGFWSYFFLFCERWGVSPLLKSFAATTVLAHPAAFFLVAGYSESLFMMGLFGFMYWSTSAGRAAKFLAILHGMIMSATRIVGIPCAAFPLVVALCQDGWNRLRDVRSWFRHYTGAIVMMIGATLGAGAFFFYCLFRWSRWDMYMLTQEAGWGIEPDYLAVFKPSSYRWQIPHLNDPVTMSQMTMAMTAVLFVVIAICELLPVIRRNTNRAIRVGFYFAAAVIYYISVSGVACVQMESMLRYEFCVHALIVLAFVHFLNQLPTPSRRTRVFGIATAAVLSAAGLGLQGWYVWNFTRGGWVA